MSEILKVIVSLLNVAKKMNLDLEVTDDKKVKISITVDLESVIK